MQVGGGAEGRRVEIGAIAAAVILESSLTGTAPGIARVKCYVTR